AGLLYPVARDLDDLAALFVIRRQVVVGDNDQLRRIPHLGAQAFQARLEAPRAARVVHHRQVYFAGNDLARRDARAPGGAGDQLLGEGLRHVARMVPAYLTGGARMKRIFALVSACVLAAPAFAADTITATHVFPASLIYSRS